MTNADRIRAMGDEELYRRQRMSENIERPPLGVKPRYLAAEERYHELLCAISASWAAGYEPDPAWVEEAWEMCQQASMRPD